MKLKKVLSLVLGGVMALSLLAGCSSSTTTTETPTVTEEPTVNTTIVSYVQSEIDKHTVGENQAAVTLTGNETADKATALTRIANFKINDGANPKTSTLGSLNYNINTGIDKYRKAMNWNYDAGKSYVFVVAKSNATDKMMANVIIDIMEKNHEVATGRYVYSSISVFDAEMTSNDSTDGSSITVDGSLAFNSNTAEYWVVVFTTAAAPAAADTSYVID